MSRSQTSRSRSLEPIPGGGVAIAASHSLCNACLAVGRRRASILVRLLIRPQASALTCFSWEGERMEAVSERAGAGSIWVCGESKWEGGRGGSERGVSIHGNSEMTGRGSPARNRGRRMSSLRFGQPRSTGGQHSTECRKRGGQRRSLPRTTYRSQARVLNMLPPLGLNTQMETAHREMGRWKDGSYWVQASGFSYWVQASGFTQ